jgi:hypothetical protein
MSSNKTTRKRPRNRTFKTKKTFFKTIETQY